MKFYSPIRIYFLRFNPYLLRPNRSSLVEGGEGCIGPSDKLLCLRQTKKIMHHMHSIIPYTFDCWADAGNHLLLLKCHTYFSSLLLA